MLLATERAPSRFLPPTSGLPIFESASSSSSWATPAARDWKGANSADHLEVSSGSLHLDQLPNFVEHVWTPPALWSTARASDGEKGGPNQSFGAGGEPLATQAILHSSLLAPPTCADGAPSSTSTPASRLQLNPDFVEWLMGWPRGWVASGYGN